MREFYYAMCEAFCALGVGEQLLVALALTLICGGVIWCVLWGLKAAVLTGLERLGFEAVDPEEIFDPEWMNRERWEELMEYRDGHSGLLR